MTSNVGSHIIQQKMNEMNNQNREQVLEDTRLQVFQLLKQTIRPEFLNRVDEIIMFTPLSQEEIRQVVELQLSHVKHMLDKNQIKIGFTEAAINWLAQVGYDPQFGARPIKRVIQRELLNQLSKEILAGKVNKETGIEIDHDGDKLVFRNEPNVVLSS